MLTTATLPPQAGRSCSSEVKPFSVTQAMRAMLAKEFQASYRRHKYNQLDATYGKQLLDALMGKADCDNEFADVDWGRRKSLVDAKQFSLVYFVMAAGRLVDGFDERILPYLTLTNRQPLTAELEWHCSKCRADWTITLIQGTPLPPDAWVCQDCGEQPFCF